MNDDSSKSLAKIAEAAGAYAELYPSIVPRLRAAAQSLNPALRKRLALLAAAAETRERRRSDRLMQMYGLTQTEARLAVHLADSGSLQSYAERFGVSVGTARSQLKSVFAKTGVNRQTALPALVGRL